MRARIGGRWAMGWIFLGIGTALVGSGRPAHAATPSEQLRVQIEHVIKVLDDAELRKDSRVLERRAAIRRIANEIFDFSETTRRSLGPHWQTRMSAEREEITRLFADLLERSYIGKIELYSGEKILYLGDTIDHDQATVHTKIITKQGADIPVDYRMLRRGDRWLAYDVSIEGVSMVANYRAQFNKIIQTSGYAGLVQKLRAKQAEGADTDAAVIKKTSQIR